MWVTKIMAYCGSYIQTQLLKFLRLSIMYKIYKRLVEEIDNICISICKSLCHKLASVHGCCVGREEGAWYIKLSRSSCECLFEVTHNSITKEFCKDSKKSQNCAQCVPRLLTFDRCIIYSLEQAIIFVTHIKFSSPHKLLLNFMSTYEF